ncbi:MAG: hypothetical protein OEO77_01495 [Acidimicrobiia bacterium]|nr:hypothetical protein [Acidimicrobiia bacterium]
MPASNDSPWFTRPLWIGLFVFLVLLVIKFDTLTEPPAWDAAMSVHPAALTLAVNGFDYPDLLDSPGYAGGGPNTHSLSTYTAVVAIAYTLFTPTTAVTVLHLLTFLLAALTVAGIVRLASVYLPSGYAVAAGLTSLSVPVVLTQFGMIYLEAPVLAASTWAMVAAVERRWPAAAAFCTLATTVKPSGLIIALAVGLFWLANYRSVWQAAVIVTPSSLLGLFIRAFEPDLLRPTIVRSVAVWRASWDYLVHVPDIWLFVLAASVASVVLSRRKGPDHDARLGDLWFWVLFGFIAFYAALGSAALTTLPRYYIQILPLAVVTVFVGLHRRFGIGALTVVMVATALVSVVNFNGGLYPRNDLSNFALIERSDAYDDLLATEVAMARAICELPGEIPVRFSSAERYRLSYPAMGYADCKDRAGPFRPNTIDLDELGAVTFVAYEEVFWAGPELSDLVTRAPTPAWTIETYDVIRVGEYEQVILLVTRR